MPNSIDVISFDADQTLFDFRRLLTECLKIAAEYLVQNTGQPFSAEQLQRTRNQAARRYEGKVFNFLDLRREAFEASVAGYSNSKQLVDEVMEVFIRHRFSKVYFMPNALETLEILHGKYRLAFLTNGNSSPEKAGIDQFFDVVIMGEDYPYRKPDPKLFGIMFEQLGNCAPDKVAHVGDSLTDDVQGANRVGSVSVWYNPDQERNNSIIVPKHEVSDLSELGQLFN